MTCFRLGQKGVLSASSSSSQPASFSNRPAAPPLVEFSQLQERASLMTGNGSGLGSASSLSGQRRRRRTKNVSIARRGRRRKIRTSKIRIVKGRVALRVSGRPGVQHIGAGQLVRFVPLNKLRAAARRVLSQHSSASRRRRRTGRVGKRRPKKSGVQRRRRRR